MPKQVTISYHDKGGKEKDKNSYGNNNKYCQKKLEMKKIYKASMEERDIEICQMMPKKILQKKIFNYK